jgi:large subunit ribosomal protein L1
MPDPAPAPQHAEKPGSEHRKGKFHHRPSRRVRENGAQRVEKPLPPLEAVNALKSFKPPKFDPTVEVCILLGVDTKQADQNIRGSVSLPKGIGKSKRVVAFCRGDQVREALDAGAVKAGAEELVAEVEAGWMDFDVAVAPPDMMRIISKLGRVLGPKGLMPSPKAGTVTPNVAQAVREYAAGKVEYRADKEGNVHATMMPSVFVEYVQPGS